MAKEFKSKIEECQEKLRNLEGKACTSTSASASVVIPQAIEPTQEHEDEVEDEDEEDDDEDEDDDDDDDYEDDDNDEEEDGEENVIIFNKRCTLDKKENDNWMRLGMGELRVKYDDDVYGACITMTSDKGETLAEHFIAIQTTMHKEGNAATWTVLNLKPEPSVTTTFRAVFSSSQALEEFATAFCEGKEYAENAGIRERHSETCVEVAPDINYYSDGADEQGVAKEQQLSLSVKGQMGTKSLPLNMGYLTSCDPNLTRDIATALQEYFPAPNSGCDEE
nr:ATP-dependent RNA helicase DRS1-like [Procambarus clarkii]